MSNAIVKPNEDFLVSELFYMCAQRELQIEPFYSERIGKIAHRTILHCLLLRNKRGLIKKAEGR